MAVLDKTNETRRLVIGDRAQVTLRATTGARADDEWISTGLSVVEAVLNAAIVDTDRLAAPGGSYTATEQGILDDSAPLQFQLNAQGTGQAEGSSNGDLGIWAPRAVTAQVTVIGKP